MTRLTKRRLEAMSAALGAMTAGEQGEGDWPEEISAEDAEAAHSWVVEQLVKREKR